MAKKTVKKKVLKKTKSKQKVKKVKGKALAKTLPKVKTKAKTAAKPKAKEKRPVKSESSAKAAFKKVLGKAIETIQKAVEPTPKKSAKKPKKEAEDILPEDDLTDDGEYYAEEVIEFEEEDTEDGPELSASDEPEGEAKPDEDVVLTDAEGRKYCRVADCDQLAAVEAYCRFHYLLFWKKIQIRKKILADNKLRNYIEELTARYPDKFIELMRKDLRTEKDFLTAIAELEIDDTAVETPEDEDAQTYIEEIRGVSTETPARTEEDY